MDFCQLATALESKALSDRFEFRAFNDALTEGFTL